MISTKNFILTGESYCILLLSCCEIIVYVLEHITVAVLVSFLRTLLLTFISAKHMHNSRLSFCLPVHILFSFKLPYLYKSLSLDWVLVILCKTEAI